MCFSESIKQISVIDFFFSFQSYEEWKNNLPDFKWLNEYLPDNERWNKLRVSLVNMKDNIKDNVEMGKLLQMFEA